VVVLLDYFGNLTETMPQKDRSIKAIIRGMTYREVQMQDSWEGVRAPVDDDLKQRPVTSTWLCDPILYRAVNRIGRHGDNFSTGLTIQSRATSYNLVNTDNVGWSFRIDLLYIRNFFYKITHTFKLSAFPCSFIRLNKMISKQTNKWVGWRDHRCKVILISAVIKIFNLYLEKKLANWLSSKPSLPLR